MKKEQIKKLALEFESLLSFLYRIIHPNKYHIQGNNNNFSLKNIYASNNTITIKGDNNTIVIEKGLTRINNCKFYVCGSNCQIRIGAFSNIRNTLFYIEDNNGVINIGCNTTITGDTQLSVIEGKGIYIGQQCLFSDNIDIRVGDSHSIIDLQNRNRINASKDVFIGDHVWIGHKVTILKGATINNDSIVATGAIITNKKFPPNSIIGGIGGSILKTGITWNNKRIPL